MDYKLQVNKIIGQPEENFWSQVHTFFPQEKAKRQAFGNLLLSISLEKKSKSELDLPSYGKEVIQRFHETYFSSTVSQISDKLTAAINKLQEEFSKELGITLIAAVVKKGRIFFARKGRALVFIKRGKKRTLIFSSGKEKVAQGRLKAEDILVLGTSWFFEAVSLKFLEEILASASLEEVTESLAGQVANSLDNSRVATLLVKVNSTGEKAKRFPTLKLRKPDIDTTKLKVVWGFVQKNLLRFLPSTRELYLKRQKGEFRKRKRLYLILAIFLISLLSLSIFLQSKKRGWQPISSDLKKATGFYEEAQNLVTLNPLRSRELLEEAENLLTSEQPSEAEEALKEKIKRLKEEVAREYKIDSATVFQDLNLLRGGTVAGDWALSGSQLLLFDKEAGVILRFDIKTKAGEVLMAGLRDYDLVAETETWGFVISKDKIIGGSLEEEEWESLKEKDWGKVIDSLGFGNNLYLLEKEGQVLKFVAIEDGLGDKREYLKSKADFSEAVSLAIDGSVWVLDKDGRIRKFTQGRPDAFTILGMDKPFNQPEVLYTDENLENLYILDRNNTRVVVLAKSGEYQAQYVWQGIAGVDGLLASEELGKILLLSRDKIYEIEIRD